MKNKVAFQGIPGSFSHITALALFGDAIQPLHTTRFSEIFQLVSEGQADYGVVPVENALAGSVHENYALLAKHTCSIIAEHYCPVQLHLLGHGSLEQIRAVISHPKALEQCSNLIESNPHITAQVWSDTASAAEHVSKLNDPTVAAIASSQAAAIYNLPAIAKSIQNNPNNSTRFVVISQQAPPPQTPATKASIIVTLPHKSGSLHQFLGEIAKAELNLTKIESIPIDGQPFAYLFHIDIECPPEAGNQLESVLNRLTSHAKELRVLGMYRAASNK